METVTFTCTAPVLIIYYTASPDPMNCTASLLPPWNGTISGHSVPAIPGTQVTFQCDNGLFPEGTMNVICLATGEWDKNPWEIVCKIEPISCILPAPRLNGALLNTTSQNTSQCEGSVITFQCDPGFSLVGAATATCNNSGLWDPDPALLECSPTATTTLSTGVTVAIGVTTTFVLSTLFLAALLVMYSFTRKKAVYYTRETALSVVKPTEPVEPVYEEVLPKEEMELHTNQAYGPLGL
ncbi:sushi, von Willebrand factor type A, EGF and pentraxin domain-containing protein 1-like isoform X2 [Halichondria panicea]|uniref:sushi, von Willebrand factor type A, EGF and pentraxin domain-containing protein 1-like isoform X2 n=1 Tax=Halichondria panicea TaxID=6063 RepID=UPI00312B85C3